MDPQTESAAWPREVETWFPVEDTGELCALGEDGPALLRLSILPCLGHVPATCTDVSSALCSFLDWHR